MIDDEIKNFWWNRITGAKMVIESVQSGLSDGKNVILDVPADLPWRSTMRSLMMELLRRKSDKENIYIYTIDVKDDCPDENPGKYLLKHFENNRSVKNGYRDYPGKTIEDYLIKYGTLKDSVIWVKGMNKSQETTWLNFCKSYSNISKDSGLFVLEVHDTKTTFDHKKMEMVRYNECVSKYDLQLFNGFVLEGKNNYNLDNKKYISTVVASLCDTDAEIACELMGTCDFEKEPVESALQRIAQSSEFSSRGADVGSKHILSYIRKNNTDEINRRIWTAQIQVIFPMIELSRVEILKLLNNEMNQLFNTKTVYQNCEVLDDPKAMEIGTLNYYVNNENLCRNNQTLRKQIGILRDCRNTLAHRQCCSHEEIKKVFECYRELIGKKY